MSEMYGISLLMYSKTPLERRILDTFAKTHTPKDMNTNDHAPFKGGIPYETPLLDVIAVGRIFLTTTSNEAATESFSEAEDFQIF